MGVGSTTATPYYYMVSAAGTSTLSDSNLATKGDTHLMIMRLYKDGTSYYNKSDIWFDPDSTLLGAPDLSATGNVTTHTNLAFFGFGLNNLETNDVIRVGSYVAGTEWADVIPEPSTVLLLLLGLGGIVWFHRKRRLS